MIFFLIVDLANFSMFHDKKSNKIIKSCHGEKSFGETYIRVEKCTNNKIDYPKSLCIKEKRSMQF